MSGAITSSVLAWTQAKNELKRLAQEYKGPTPPENNLLEDALNRLESSNNAMRWGAQRWESKMGEHNAGIAGVLRQYTSEFFSTVNSDLRKNGGTP